MRVLIVEDEPHLAEALQEGLRLAAIAADIANDGEAALESLWLNDYDVVVLDRDLPGMHGDEVCRIIADEHASTRVLMLTASGTLRDKVQGFELGADDYLAKPFDFPELVARVRALGRRSPAATPVVLTAGGIRLDPFRMEVTRDGRAVALGRKEFGVLEVLIGAAGGFVSAEALLEKAWGENIDPFTSTVRVTISTLRKKLGTPSVIETVAGVGYRIVEDRTVAGAHDRR